MTLESVRVQVNSLEVSFYPDLESFRLLFGIDFLFFGVISTSLWHRLCSSLKSF